MRFRQRPGQVNAPQILKTKRLAYPVMRRAFAQARREEQGSVLLEFAASAILLFTVIFGIMDFCRALYTDHFIASAAHEATRYAMVRGASWNAACSTPIAYSCTASAADISSFVQSLATAGIQPSAISTSVSWPGKSAGGSACSTSHGAASAGCAVIVVVTYTFKFVLPLLPATGLRLSSTSEMTIVQ